MQMYKTAFISAIGLVLLAGCSLFQRKQPEPIVRLFCEVERSLPEENAHVVAVPKTGLKIPISTFAILTENDVESVKLNQTSGGAVLELHLDPSGRIQLDEVTTRCRGQYIVAFLGRRPVEAWLVDRRVTNGVFVVEGDFTDEEAQKAVDDLNKLIKAKKSR